MTAWTEADLHRRGLRISTPARFTPATDAVTIKLPTPPSVNACWANVEGVGRVRSTAYRRWSKLAVQEVQAQRAGRVAGKFSVVIETLAYCPLTDATRHLIGARELAAMATEIEGLR